MRPVLFTVGGRRIWSYPALLYAGLLTGFYVMYAIAPAVGCASAPAALSLLILFAPALAGARLWFVVDHWSYYRREPARAWRRSEGGMTLYGGLVLAVALSPVVLTALAVSFAAFWDAATVAILVAMVFTRAGCLLNGCCSGRASDGRLTLCLPDHAGHRRRRHPVQIFEMTAAFTLLLGSVGMLLIRTPQGTIFIFGLSGYACVRLALDRLRERPGQIVTVSGHRTAAIVFLIGSLAPFAAGCVVMGG